MRGLKGPRKRNSALAEASHQKTMAFGVVCCEARIASLEFRPDPGYLHDLRSFLMAWNEPGGGDKDPWSGGGNQGPPDLDEAFKKLQQQLSGIFGRQGDGGGGGGFGQMVHRVSPHHCD